MTIETDPSGMLAALIAAPADRTGRLAYADWLDEHDRGDEAEFVRLQCQKAVGVHGRVSCRYACRERIDYRCGWCLLLDRERELLAPHEQRWRASGPCEKCGGSGEIPGPATIGGRHHADSCFECHGTGDRGGLLQKFRYSPDTDLRPDSLTEPVRIDWSRYPLLTLQVPRLSDCVTEKQLPVEYVCKVCGAAPDENGEVRHDRGCYRIGEDGGGSEFVEMTTRLTPTPWLAAVVRHHPTVIGVEAMDREPFVHGNGSASWRRQYHTTPARSELPEPLLSRLQDRYVTPEEARAALGREIVAFAKS